MQSGSDSRATIWPRLKCLIGLHALKAPTWVPVDANGFIKPAHFIAKCEYCKHRREVYVTE